MMVKFKVYKLNWIRKNRYGYTIADEFLAEFDTLQDAEKFIDMLVAGQKIPPSMIAIYPRFTL